jgi:hypothetical protein
MVTILCNSFTESNRAVMNFLAGNIPFRNDVPPDGPPGTHDSSFKFDHVPEYDASPYEMNQEWWPLLARWF